MKMISMHDGMYPAIITVSLLRNLTGWVNKTKREAEPMYLYRRIVDPLAVGVMQDFIFHAPSIDKA
jgi:hypothetical protein